MNIKLQSVSPNLCTAKGVLEVNSPPELDSTETRIGNDIAIEMTKFIERNV